MNLYTFMTSDKEKRDDLSSPLFYNTCVNIIPFVLSFASFATSQYCQVYDFNPPLGTFQACNATTNGFSNLPPQLFISLAIILTMFINLLYAYGYNSSYVHSLDRLKSMWYPIIRTGATSYLLFITMDLKVGVQEWFPLVLIISGSFLIAYGLVLQSNIDQHDFVCKELRDIILNTDPKNSSGLLIPEQGIERYILAQAKYMKLNKYLKEQKRLLDDLNTLYTDSRFRQLSKTTYSAGIPFIFVEQKDKKTKLNTIYGLNDTEDKNSYNIIEKNKAFFKITKNVTDKKSDDNNRQFLIKLNLLAEEIAKYTEKILRIYDKAEDIVRQISRIRKLPPRSFSWDCGYKLVKDLGLLLVSAVFIFIPPSLYLMGRDVSKHIALLTITYLYIALEWLLIVLGIFWYEHNHTFEKLLLFSQVLFYLIITIILLVDTSCGRC